METINEGFVERIKKSADRFNPGIQVPQLIREARKVLTQGT